MHLFINLGHALRACCLLTIALTLSLNSTHGAAVFGHQRSPQGDVELLYLADDATGKVRIELKGPAGRWFAWGFNATRMAGTYAMVVEGTTNPTLVERQLGNHNAGSLLASSITIHEQTIVDGSVYISASRNIQHPNFTFPTTPGTLPVIWGRGTGPSLAYHGNGRGPLAVTSKAFSRPRFTSIHVATNMALISMENLVEGLNYRLEFTEDIVNTPWLVATNFAHPTFELNLSLPKPNQGFFRLRPGLAMPPQASAPTTDFIPLPHVPAPSTTREPFPFALNRQRLIDTDERS